MQAQHHLLHISILLPPMLFVQLRSNNNALSHTKGHHIPMGKQALQNEIDKRIGRVPKQSIEYYFFLEYGFIYILIRIVLLEIDVVVVVVVVVENVVVVVVVETEIIPVVYEKYKSTVDYYIQ